ncbi:MAG: N-acetyltransferase [Candidatus Bipolaricaulota bacterium]|nr:MAG: N-acetyltransferase [Candidatus Bipolaricaulota bacterium]
MAITIEPVPLGDPRIRTFVRVPWLLHHGDPHWTPPLRADLLGSRVLGMTGLLTPRHPYHEHAEVTHFIARDGRRPVGRVSAAVNRRINEQERVKRGHFGFFETSDRYEVTERLLDAAREWLSTHGMEAMRGPGGYTNATHEPHQAVLVDGFDTPPTVELTHNPPFYGAHLERYGLRKVKDYHAYWVDIDAAPLERVGRLVDRFRERRKIETRPLELSQIRREVDDVVTIYNEAWASNWGFLPLTEDEAEAMAAVLKIVADPGLMRFAYVGGELAAVLGALPDPNVPLRPRWNRLLDSDPVRVARLLATKRRIPVIRLMFFGIRPRFRRAGIDAVLYHEVLQYALARRYRFCEPSMLLEDNDLVLRASRSMGGHRYKTWRVYEMPIES